MLPSVAPCIPYIIFYQSTCDAWCLKLLTLQQVSNDLEEDRVSHYLQGEQDKQLQNPHKMYLSSGGSGSFTAHCRRVGRFGYWRNQTESMFGSKMCASETEWLVSSSDEQRRPRESQNQNFSGRVTSVNWRMQLPSKVPSHFYEWLLGMTVQEGFTLQ